MNLIQEKLNVKFKKRTNLFNWRGQFTPEFVEYILDSVQVSQDALIIDPFAGSGTVLIEAALKGLSSVGFEINPSAYHMAKFYEYSSLNYEGRVQLLKNIESKTQSILLKLNGQPIYNKDATDYRTSYLELIKVAKKIKKISCDEDVSFLINMLFASEKDQRLTVKDSLNKSFTHFKNALLNLPYMNADITVHNCDARKVSEYYPNQADLIMTSPPYINVFNYHQNYRAVTESFDYDILNVAHSEFGSNRKNRGNRLLTVIQYCIDMETSINSFWHSLKDNASLVMVVGRESNVRKTPFYNGDIVTELISQMNCFTIEKSSERSFTNKFGKKITEDIIVAKKNINLIPMIGNAQKIARKHLLKAQKKASAEVKSDFTDALSKVDNIKPSPIFE